MRISKKRMMLADLPGNFNQALARSFCRGSAWSPAVTRSSVLKNVTDAVQRVGLVVIRDFYGTCSASVRAG